MRATARFPARIDIWLGPMETLIRLSERRASWRGADHRCIVHDARWGERPGGVFFEVRANRFLHHMVRFLVATMLDIAAGRREESIMTALLQSDNNHDSAAPAPPHALYLERVEYPAELYLQVT